MPKPYRLVVFDWEGTLGDSLGEIVKTIEKVAQDLQLGAMPNHVNKQMMVHSLALTLKKMFPHLSHRDQAHLLGAVQNALINHATEVCLMPGAETILLRLQRAGVELAIATNKSAIGLERVLQASGLRHFFSTTRAAGQVAPKPCPDMLQEIMDVCDVTPHETLMVGDSVTDIEMAKNAGVDAIGMDFYQGQMQHLRQAGAIEVFDDYQQLSDYLKLE